MSELIISVSGLRGIVGDSLTPEIAARYALAFVDGLPRGPIVITRDGRPSGPLLAQAINLAIAAGGRDCLDGGVAATPTTGVLVRHEHAAGGIQISASHNPAQYNGLKLFSHEGRVIPAIEGAKVIERYRERPAGRLPNATPGIVRKIDDTIAEHCRLVMALVDVEQIRKRRFNVLVDANHGAGSLLGRRLLETLDCRVTMLGGEPDGQFEHVPEPTAENLETVLPLVTANQVDVGFCLDPDADRLAIIDENARYIGEEYTLALYVDHVLRRRKGPIVTNCSTSRMSEDLASKYGVPFYRSAVGEANVVDAMNKHQAILGGEGNGGVIEPRVGWVRDSFVAMAFVLEAMVSRERRVSELADELPKYAISKTKISLPPEKLADGLAALEKHFSDARPDRLDGLRLDWPNKWLLVRPSNTEPIVRAIAEAPTAEEAARLCAEAAAVLARR